jgi:RND family efflux transporter MFP subunit
MRRFALGSIFLFAAVSAQAEEVWIAEGMVVPRHTAYIRARTAEAVADVLVDVGSTIKKGDVLLRFDDKQARNDVRMAALNVKKKEVELRLAESRLEGLKAMFELTRTNVERLRKSNAIAESEIAKAEAELGRVKAELQGNELQAELARIEIEMAKTILVAEETKLDLLTIKAPFDGVVAARQVHPGDFVRADAPLLDLYGGPLLAEASVPEKFLAYAKVGRAVDVVLGKERDAKTTKGKISRTAVAMNAQNRSLRIEIELPGIGQDARAGTLVDVKTDDPNLKEKEKD